MPVDSVALTFIWFITVVIPLAASYTSIPPALASTRAASVTASSPSLSYSNWGAWLPISLKDSTMEVALVPNFIDRSMALSPISFKPYPVIPVRADKSFRLLLNSSTDLPAATPTATIPDIAATAKPTGPRAMFIAAPNPPTAAVVPPIVGIKAVKAPEAFLALLANPRISPLLKADTILLRLPDTPEMLPWNPFIVLLASSTYFLYFPTDWAACLSPLSC